LEAFFIMPDLPFNLESDIFIDISLS